MSITAIVENGTIKLPVHVPDGTEVEIVLPQEKSAATGAKKNQAWMLKDAGGIDTLPAGAAGRHDEYQRELFIPLAPIRPGPSRTAHLLS